MSISDIPPRDKSKSILATPEDGSDDIKLEYTAQNRVEKNLGILPVVCLIINRMIGTGIFSTPSGVYSLTGSVGVSLIFWVVGGILALCGLCVYLEFGLRIPRSGGEKNYLERVYKRPKLMTTFVFLVNMVVLGFSSGNSFAFGRYVLFASGHENPNAYLVRAIGVSCITFCVLLHALFPKAGVMVMNFLGIFKIAVVIFIVFSGFAALAGHIKVPNPDNFTNAFSTTWSDGATTGSAYAYATALLRIVYSYKGWENANYVLSEVKNPNRTMKIAGPLAVIGMIVLYTLANVAYFAAVSKTDFAESEVVLAGIYFRNMFGRTVGVKVLPAFVAASNLGNVLAVSYAQSRVNQDFALEGLLPWSKIWATNKPCGAPSGGLFLHWIISLIFLLAPPPGPTYNLLVDLYSYPGTWIGAFVAMGLFYLHHAPSQKNVWKSPWRASSVAIVIFFLSNVYLAVIPFVPPPHGKKPDGYPPYIYPVVGIAVIVLGIIYWACWTHVFPYLLDYTIESTPRENVDDTPAVWVNGLEDDDRVDDVEPQMRYFAVKNKKN